MRCFQNFQEEKVGQGPGGTCPQHPRGPVLKNEPASLLSAAVGPWARSMTVSQGWMSWRSRGVRASASEAVKSTERDGTAAGSGGSIPTGGTNRDEGITDGAGADLPKIRWNKIPPHYEYPFQN